MRCPSVAPEDHGALDVMEKALKPLGFKCTRLPFEDAKAARVENLYARLGTSGKNLCFAGHTDVVPPGDLSLWTTPPYAPEIRDGVLYGRGASDMKTAIAAWVVACAEYIKEKGQPKGSLSLLITGDEEAVAINGTRKVLEWCKKHNETIDACIVGEPTNPKALGDMIKIGRRGSVSFTIEVRGVQGHVAYPLNAKNPVPVMAAIIHALSLHKIDTGTEHFQPSNLEFSTVDVNNPTDNVIPASAKATCNIRFNDTQTAKKLEAWVDSVCKSAMKEGYSYTLTSRHTGDAFLTKPGFLSDIVSAAVKKITGKTPELSTTGGTSDARFIKDYCPVVEFGLINVTAHRVNEAMPVADIENLVKIYKEVIRAFFA
ncbi:MAG: succinyl-diaminopimelate desuccinylase [Proteobacteria bacterium]|nr:succinyl-diaminopimelate desuccinylase [Pseudomonadota bacterium]